MITTPPARRRPLAAVLAPLLVALLGAGPAAAQPADSLAARSLSVPAFSLSFGTGLGPPTVRGSRQMATGGLDVAHALRSGGVVQAGVSVSGTVAFLLGGDDVMEGHLAGGVQRQAGGLRLTAVAGPALVLASRSTRDAPDEGGRRRTLLGAFVSVRAGSPFSSAVGAGVEAFAHLNAAVPVVGVRGALTLGGRAAPAAHRGP